MFEYRFGGNGELSGHNLGNLMLKALDHLSVRPLEAINLIRNLLKVDAHLIPMSEHPVDLMAIDDQGHEVYGEVNIDQLTAPIQELLLTPNVPATREAAHAISEADLIIIGPRQFLHQPDANSAAEGNRTGITPHASADGLYRQSGA